MENQHLSECQKLAERLTALEADGVVDVKFFLRSQGDATVEDACRELNDMLEAVDCGEFEVVTFDDSHR